MILTNNKGILLYGFSKEEMVKIEAKIKESELPSYRVIEESMVKMTVRDIIEGHKIETFNNNMPEEKVILFNNLSDIELDIAVKLLGSIENTKPILAVVTPMSIDWSFQYLVNHLVEEREWFKREN